MTLYEVFEWISSHPFVPIIYFSLLPVLTFFTGFAADGKSAENPYRYIYMFILYLACVPGITSIILLAYSFLFESLDILSIDLFIHILPLVAMVVTIFVMNRFVSLDDVPGFKKLSGLLLMIGVALIFLWILDRTHIIVLIHLNIFFVLLILAALIFVFRLGMKKAFG